MFKQINTTQITLFCRRNAATLRFSGMDHIEIDNGYIKFNYVSESQGTKHRGEFPLSDFAYTWKVEA